MNNRMNRYRNGSACPCNNENANNGMGGNVVGSDALLALKKRLQKIEFSLVDTILYLDAYPDCKAAMAHYKKLLEERDSLVAKLNAAGVPMTSMSNYSDTWNWVDSPWPWEYSANV